MIGLNFDCKVFGCKTKCIAIMKKPHDGTTNLMLVEDLSSLIVYANIASITSAALKSFMISYYT